jgi:hypothetical protein
VTFALVHCAEYLLAQTGVTAHRLPSPYVATGAAPIARRQSRVA